jgi:hypothetical protein
MKETRVRPLWHEKGFLCQFRSGVSLHSHTMHSRENLAFIPRYGEAFPPLAWEIRRQARKYREKYDRDIDYTRGFWTPPLPAANAFELEKRNIEQELGLAALVSLSDHDNIEAATTLRAVEETSQIPISIEWTVPAGPSFFHIGIHNLPPAEADSIVEEFRRFKLSPSDGRRNELLAAVTGWPDTLVVLNHPLWDQSSVSTQGHHVLLDELLDSSGEFFHAIELNGFRPWPENQLVTNLARALGRPLVAGGDRHGCEPAAVVNVTPAASFAEFAAEVRAGVSEVVLLPNYREPVRFRLCKSLLDIMREYPELPGRERWSDRVFCCTYTGDTNSLSQMVNGGAPHVVRYFERAVKLTCAPRVQKLLRMYFDDGTEPDHTSRALVDSAG